MWCLRLLPCLLRVIGLIRLVSALGPENPPVLTSTDVLESGIPVKITCSADTVSLDPDYKLITKLTMRRKLRGEDTFDKLAQYNPYFPYENGREVEHIPKGRRWEITFTGATPQPSEESRKMKILLRILDTQCEDTGLYDCLVNYHNNSDAKFHGQQNLTFLDPVTKITMTVETSDSNNENKESDNMTLTCKWMGPPGLFIQWFASYVSKGQYKTYEMDNSKRNITASGTLNDTHVMCGKVRHEESLSVQMPHEDTVVIYTCRVVGLFGQDRLEIFGTENITFGKPSGVNTAVSLDSSSASHMGGVFLHLIGCLVVIMAM